MFYLSSTAARLPDPGRLTASDAQLATVLYARGGEEIARYYRENRTWTPYRELGTSVRRALVATEDRRFFHHGGVDWRRLAAGAWQTARGDRQGGSTLTMQFARNRYDDIAASPPLERKAKEVLMALKLERTFGKKAIMEAYLNTVSFGHGAHGIGAAAQTYFDTTAAALGPARSALLVGMLKGPTRYSPTRAPERARQRRNVVLRQMQRRGHITEAQTRRLQARPLGLQMNRPALTKSPAPHFAEAVRRRVAAWAEARGLDLYTDGLHIHTTLDLAAQRDAHAAVRTQTRKLEAVAAYEWSQTRPRLLSENVAPYVRRASGDDFEPFARLWTERPILARSHVRRSARFRRALATPSGSPADTSAVLERLLGDAAFMDSLRRDVARLRAGLVAVEPQTAAVRAYVGGRTFSRDQYDKAGLARRQPGSTFKPFVWAAALRHGFAPHDALRDGELPDPFATHRRTRSSDGGGLTLRAGLAYSSNRMAEALTRAVGPSEVARTARQLGIRSPLRTVPSLALGTSEVRLLELTAAYAALADGGMRRTPRLVTRIADAEGAVLERFPPPRGARGLDRHTTHTLLRLMRGVVDRGTGRPLRRDWQMRGADLAGKTGTTQENADGWFLAMHPRLTVGAWTGFNDRRVAFRTEHWGHGSSNALRLVGAFLEKRLAARPGWETARFRPPPGYRAPRPPRAVDSSYAAYETVGDGFGADPGATDTRLRDAIGQGLDSVRAGLGEMPRDRLTRRDADPETALRSTLPDRRRAAPRATYDSVEALPRPAPVRTPPARNAPSDAGTRNGAPAPIRARDLDDRIRTRRDTSGER